MDKNKIKGETDNKISVVINTYNASMHLEEVLETVKGFDEVVVCDMESTDETVAIAQRYGCKVVVFPRGNYQICEPARQCALDAASHKWILVVDADELVPAKLKEYLYDLISLDDAPRGIVYPKKELLHGQVYALFLSRLSVALLYQAGYLLASCHPCRSINRRQGGENSCREERLGAQSSSRWKRAVSHRQDQSIYRERGGEEKEQALWYAGIVLSPIGSFLQGIRAEGRIPRRQGRIDLCLL